MARSVGSIEVTVDADTGKLKAQLVKDGKIAGEATAKAIEKELKNLRASIDLEDDKVRAKAKLLRKQIEASMKGIDVGFELNTIQAKKDLATFEEYAEATRLAIEVVVSDKDLAQINTQIKAFSENAEKIKLRGELDLAEAKATIKAWKFAQQRDAMDMPINPDFTEMNARLAAFRRSQAFQSVDVNFKPDFTEINAALLRFQKDQTITFESRVDVTKANVALKAWRERQEANDIEIPVSIDPKATDQIRNQLSQIGDGGGGANAGSIFGDTFGKAAKKGINKQGEAIAAAVLALGEPIVTALQGLTAGAIAVSASAINGLAGAAGAALPIFAGFGGAITGVVLAMNGMGDAYSAAVEGDMEAFNKALEKMTPNGVAFANVMKDEIVPAVNNLRNELQSKLFSGLDTAFTSFIDKAGPSFTAGMAALIVPVNTFVKDTLKAFEGFDFATVFSNLQGPMDSVLDGVRALMLGFGEFIAAATPAANVLGEMFQTWAVSFADFDAGNVQDFLLRGVESLRVWLDMFGAIGDVISAVWAPAIASGDSMIGDLTGKIQEFATWLQGNQGAVANFFSEGETIVKSFGPILEGLKDAFNTLVTPESIARLEEFNRILGDEGLQNFANVLQSISESGVAEAFIQGLSDTFRSLLPIIDALAPALQAMFSNFEIMGPLLIALVVPGGALIKMLVLLAEPLAQVATIAAGPISAALQALGSIMQVVADAVGELLIAMAPGIIEVFAAVLGTVAEVVDTLFTALQDAGVIDILADGFLTVLEALTPLLPAISRLAQTILPPLAEVFAAVAESGIDVIVQLVEALVPVIVDLADQLGPMIADILPQLAEMWTTIFAAIQPLIPVFAQLVVSLAPLIPAALQLMTAFLPLLDLILPLIPVVAELAAMFIGVLVPAVDGIVLGLTAFSDIFSGIIETVANFVGEIIGFFQNLFDVLVGNSIIPDLVAAIIGAFGGMITEVLGAIGGRVFDMIAKFAGLWVDVLSGIAGFVIDFAADLAGMFLDGIEAVGGFIEDFLEFFTDLPGDIADAIEDGASALINLGESIVDWIVEGIGNVGGAIADKITGLVPDSVLGVDLPWKATGGMFDRPTVIGVGERGREALVPLDLPLNQVDPSVRQMAAMIRGYAPSTAAATAPPGASKVISPTLHIYEVGDGEATAHRVVNRIAAMAVA